MSTRSLTIIKDQAGNDIVVMYRQTDGYPSGHGQELADYLKDHTITNGISAGKTWDNAFNGAECMAASIVAHFKPQFGIGGIYLYAPQADGDYDHGQEYTYTVTVKDSRPFITTSDGQRIVGSFANDYNFRSVEAALNV